MGGYYCHDRGRHTCPVCTPLPFGPARATSGNQLTSDLTFSYGKILISCFHSINLSFLVFFYCSLFGGRTLMRSYPDSLRTVCPDARFGGPACHSFVSTLWSGMFRTEHASSLACDSPFQSQSIQGGIFTIGTCEGIPIRIGDSSTMSTWPCGIAVERLLSPASRGMGSSIPMTHMWPGIARSPDGQ